jgi:hypothetical protein
MIRLRSWIVIENVSRAFDAGEVTVEHVEQMLALAYPDDENERAERRQRVMPDGKIIKFQLVALNQQAAQAIRDNRKNPPQPAAPDEPDVPEQFLVDVPEEIDEFRGPDYVPEIKNRLGIIAAVRMFGKQQAAIRDSRTEGIKVRCPFSFHVDNRPSAWVNTEKNTWYCGKCQTGGDVIDFYAAAKHDLEKDQFHRSPEFRAITEEMAEALGIEVFTPFDSTAWASPLPDATEDSETIDPPTPLDDDVVPVQEEDRESDPPVPVVPPSHEAEEPITVTTDEMVRGISFESEPDEDTSLDTAIGLGIQVPRYDPERLGLTEGTFLYSWMAQHAYELPWVPPEYLMMLGFQALGLASGHSVISISKGLRLNGALMMVLIGPSGYGKSTAANKLRRMLLTVEGPRWNQEMGTGVKLLPSPGSAEALVAIMRTDIEDPVNGPATIETPTTAWLFEDEFATFIERTRRRGGSHLKQRLMQFYDFVKEEEGPELVMHDFSLSGKLRNVHDSFMSALFLTQTQSIRTLAERSDLVSGFMNRIVPVFGVQRERQRFDTDLPSEPFPEYFGLYEDVWRKCHADSTIGNPIVMPFTQDARQLAQDHPFFEKADRLGEEASIYARLHHITMRLALLLAINDRVPDTIRTGNSLQGDVVDAPELRVAIDVVQKFIQPGYAALVEAVSADEVYELSGEIIGYMEGYFSRKARWPLVSEVMARPFWKKYGPVIGPRAVEHLRFSKQIAEVRLQSKNGKKQDIMIATRGSWASFSSHTGKTFQSEAFYGNSTAASGN